MMAYQIFLFFSESVNVDIDLLQLPKTLHGPVNTKTRLYCKKGTCSEDAK